MQKVGDDMVGEIQVLAIDAQIFSLQYLCAVLHKCNYKVKTTTSGAEARDILSGDKHGIDVVLVDVDSSGFELLETIGLETYLPVIMLTGDDSLENLTKGLLYGAIDYIIKPVGEQEIKNATQRIVALNKKKNSRKSSDNKETSDNKKPKHKANKESADASPSRRKKRRLVWTRELDAKFVEAVQSLEKISSTVHPKRILNIMKEPGLTRENIASHLQKYRNSVTKQKAEANQQGFESERFIRSSSARSTSRRKWPVADVSADPLAVPRFNRFQPMIPHGGSLVPDNSFQSLLNGYSDDPTFQNFGLNSSDDYNYGLETNILPHSVGSDPSAGSSAPFYQSLNADQANFQSPFPVNSVPNLVPGGVPNDAAVAVDCANIVEYPGSTVLAINGEVNGTTTSPATDVSSQHNIERDNEVPEMDHDQADSEESFDFYSLFNDDAEDHSSLTDTI